MTTRFVPYLRRISLSSREAEPTIEDQWEWIYRRLATHPEGAKIIGPAIDEKTIFGRKLPLIQRRERLFTHPHFPEARGFIERELGWETRDKLHSRPELLKAIRFAKEQGARVVVPAMPTLRSALRIQERIKENMPVRESLDDFHAAVRAEEERQDMENRRFGVRVDPVRKSEEAILDEYYRNGFIFTPWGPYQDQKPYLTVYPPGQTRKTKERYWLDRDDGTYLAKDFLSVWDAISQDCTLYLRRVREEKKTLFFTSLPVADDIQFLNNPRKPTDNLYLSPHPAENCLPVSGYVDTRKVFGYRDRLDKKANEARKTDGYQNRFAVFPCDGFRFTWGRTSQDYTLSQIQNDQMADDLPYISLDDRGEAFWEADFVDFGFKDALLSGKTAFLHSAPIWLVSWKLRGHIEERLGFRVRTDQIDLWDGYY